MSRKGGERTVGAAETNDRIGAVSGLTVLSNGYPIAASGDAIDRSGARIVPERELSLSSRRPLGGRYSASFAVEHESDAVARTRRGDVHSGCRFLDVAKFTRREP